jgi:CBS domain-containing protein
MANLTSLMTANPACCSAETPLREVARMMIDNDCGEIPVVDASGVPVGVVTDRDITVRIVAQGRDTMNATASEAMSSPVKTVREDSTLKDATALMESAKIRRVPVVGQGGKLTGIVSLADIALAAKDKLTVDVVKEVSAPGKKH